MVSQKSSFGGTDSSKKVATDSMLSSFLKLVSP